MYVNAIMVPIPLLYLTKILTLRKKIDESFGFRETQHKPYVLANLSVLVLYWKSLIYIEPNNIDYNLLFINILSNIWLTP